MSARREARSRIPVLVRADGQVPPSLVVGRCLEVWADPKAESGPSSTMRRYSTARDFWGGVTDLDKDELRGLLPNGSPWSADYLIEEDRADVVLERLARAGCTPHDIPELRAEAAHLLKLADNRKARP